MPETPLYPQFYSQWLAPRLPHPVKEAKATCSTCVMTTERLKPDAICRDPGPFEPDLKCCTYFPVLPNFSLGRMLSEGSVETRSRVQVSLALGLSTPLGLFQPSQWVALESARGNEGFGVERGLLCPFFDCVTYDCRIWENRPATCATYFCQSSAERAGLEFWSLVEEYLGFFEWTLAHEVLWRLGWTLDDTKRIESARQSLERGEGVEMDTLWLDEPGRGGEFFIRAYHEAKSIGPRELAEILGEEGLAYERQIEAARLRL